MLRTFLGVLRPRIPAYMMCTGMLGFLLYASTCNVGRGRALGCMTVDTDVGYDLPIQQPRSFLHGTHMKPCKEKYSIPFLGTWTLFEMQAYTCKKQDS